MAKSQNKRNAEVKSRRSFLKKMLAGGALATGALASPLGLPKALAGGGDLDVLNYALTLEHLEAAFYRDGIANFSRKDFEAYNVGSLDTYDAFLLIRDHELEHVRTLTAVITNLGGTPVGECTYNFGDAFTDPNSFVETAQTLENTGVTAYDGAINLISNPDLLTAGATIATVEARHASYLNLIAGDIPFPAAFDTPRTMQQILDIINNAGFIVSCP